MTAFLLIGVGVVLRKMENTSDGPGRPLAGKISRFSLGMVYS